MSRKLLGALALVGIASLVGCMPVMDLRQPGVITAAPGIIFMDVQGGTQVVDPNLTPTKEGKSCSTGVLGMVATGDNRLETAMHNGGIKKVAFVNTSVKSYVFGVYAEVCTLVRGN